MTQTKSATNLIHGIYAAVSDTGSWSTFLGEVAEATGATCGAFYWRDDRNHQYDVMALHNLPDDYVSLYTQHYATTDEWINRGSGILKTGWVGLGQELCSERELTSSEFGSDFLTKFDVFYQLGAIITQQDSLRSALTLLRPKKRKSFADRSVALLGVLMPHIQQALAVRQKVVRLESRNQMLEHAINSSSTATIVVGNDLRVLWMNDRAKSLVGKKQGMRITGKYLTAFIQSDTMRLQNAVNLAQARGGHAGISSVVPISRPLTRPLSVSVAPGISRPFAEFKAAAVLFLSDPDDDLISLDALQGVFHLTPAEAKVTIRLVRGRDLHSICAELSISYYTARAHLRSIFQKIGVSRQSDLVSQVLRLANSATTVKNGFA